MRRFRVEESFWALFPAARIGVIVCRGMDNDAAAGAESERMLAAAVELCRERLKGVELVSHPAIAVWRDALKRFKTEKGARASVEAMARRILNGNSIRTINPLVNIYNSVSLRYLLPCGGEDLDRIVGDMVLTRAFGDEPFIPLGEMVSKPPVVGEVIYRDDLGAVVRGWLWREADRTKITEQTRNALLYMELLDEAKTADQVAAVEELAAQAGALLGGTRRIGYLSRQQPEIPLD